MTKYRNVSLRKELVDDIEEFLEKIGHYPSISSFVHESLRLRLNSILEESEGVNNGKVTEGLEKLFQLENGFKNNREETSINPAIRNLLDQFTHPKLDERLLELYERQISRLKVLLEHSFQMIQFLQNDCVKLRQENRELADKLSKVKEEK